MVEKVIKRDNKTVNFNKEKIVKAIGKAFASSEHSIEEGNACAEKIATDIMQNAKEVLSVEEIGDIVEKKLMATSYKDVAKNFITYRQLKTMARTQYKELWDTIAEKLNAKNVQNQNANVDEHSFGGRTGEATGVMTKKYALDYLVSPMAKNNHEGNMIYIHDLDSYAVGSHNCLSIPFDDLLKNGFNTRQTDVRPAGSVNTAFQLVAVIFQLQSLQQFGGVSATHLDWTMVPYVRMSFLKHYKTAIELLNNLPLVKLKTTEIENIRETSINDNVYQTNFLKKIAWRFAKKQVEKEVHQAVEGMYHNLND